MSDKKTEALKLALEALVKTDAEPGSKAWEREAEAITAIREALADQQAHEEIERAMSQVWQDVPGAVNFGVDPKPAQQQEPVAWATREDFYRELGRSVERAREEMKVKSVTMRCKDYDLALPIIDAHFGHVLVGQISTPPTSKPWVELTDDDIQEVRENCGVTHHAIKTIEAKLREKNTGETK